MRVNRRKWFSESRAKIKVSKGWGVASYPRNAQEFVPRDPKLMQKIGLKKGERIIFFAGCYGDWAAALSKSCEVKYTDVSDEMLRAAKAKNPNAAKSFRVAAAETVPQRMKVFDWSFSFEPYPLSMHRGINLSLMRSLLNRKGLLMVFSPMVDARNEIRAFFERRTRKIAELYGAGFEKKSVVVHGEGKKGFENRKSYVFVMRTNNVAREKVRTDLKVLKLLEREETLTRKELSERVGVSLKDINESIRRIGSIGRLHGVTHYIRRKKKTSCSEIV